MTPDVPVEEGPEPRRVLDPAPPSDLRAAHEAWHGPGCSGQCEVMRFIAALPAPTPEAAGLPVIDWTFDDPTATYDLPGRCLTCGTRFVVRRNKGVKPPLSVECPSCECSEYSWRDLSILTPDGQR